MKTVLPLTTARRSALLTAALAAAIFAVAPAQAGPPTPHLQVDNPLPAVQSEFGRNMSVTSDGKILLGSDATIGDVEDAGAAYLIDPETGAVDMTIPNPDPESGVGFGAFSWSGDTRIIVSAFFKNHGTATKAGRVYVFDKATGAHTLTIMNPTPEDNDEFGYGLGMLGDTAIISSRADNAAGPGTGTVYLFNTLTGDLLKTIPNPDPTTQDNFGYSVTAIGTDKILVGAPNNDTGATDAGAAYLLDASTGDVFHSIYNPVPDEGAAFGFQVRAHGENLLIGSPGNNKAFLFDGATGQMIHQFDNPDQQPGFTTFGSAVGSAGQYILIGNPIEPVDSMEWVGRAYVYDTDSGARLYTLENPTPAAHDRFGVSVVGVNGKIVISADQNQVGDFLYCGSIYIYNGPTTSACCDWTLYH